MRAKRRENFRLTTPTNYITLAGTKGGLEPAEPYASYAPAQQGQG